MLDTIINIAQLLIEAGLIIWVLILRRELQTLRLLLKESRPRDITADTLSSDDMQALRDSLAGLVQEIESYTEEHRREMVGGVEEVRSILGRIERESRSPSSPSSAGESTRNPSARRVLRITPGGRTIQHPQADQIRTLHDSGRSVDEIARELRLNKGEVQLVISLS